jgi:hypothetical protein
MVELAFMVELAVVLEELGHAVAATPLLGSALPGLAIAHAGDDEPARALAAGLASGELRARSAASAT